MKRKEIIAMLEKELTKVHEQIKADESITEEQRENLLSTSNSLLESLEEAKADETENLQLEALCMMFGKDFAELLDDDGDDDADDPLSALANNTDGTSDDGSIRNRPVWQKIRHILRDEMNLKNILYGEDEEDYVTAQFGMGDGEGKKLTVRVIYTPDADSVQMRAGFPFDIDLQILPIARTYVCQRNYEMRYTRIEMDQRDGEVYIATVMRLDDPDKLSSGSFVRLLHLTMSTGFDEYDTFRRYSRAEITDDERAHFLGEVERISKLMLGEQ